MGTVECGLKHKQTTQSKRGDRRGQTRAGQERDRERQCAIHEKHTTGKNYWFWDPRAVMLSRRSRATEHGAWHAGTEARYHTVVR